MLLGIAWRWYDSGRFDRYYNTLPTGEREIADHIHEPVGALSEVKAAIVQTSEHQETRLRVAMLAYSLWINGQGPQDVFDRALLRLGNSERVRFEEARWGHYYGALDKNTFGFPTIKDPAKAIVFIKNAIPYVAPDLQVEVALTSYGAFTNVDSKTSTLANISFDLWKRALDALDKPGVDKRLNESNRFRARLLKGHYLLEMGNRSGSRAREAEEWYQKAAQTYAEARTISLVGDYWKVEYNTCNALYSAAEAAEKYRDASAVATPEERDSVNGVIQRNLDQALEGCKKAQELAPAKSWQPSYLVGSILLKESQPRLAAESYLRGYNAAQIAREEASYVAYLASDTDRVRPLCQNRDFSRTFVSICRP
jgi:hypothetical protein